MLKVIGANKKYNKLVILDNVNLELNKGKIIGLVGPNGIGKTTFIRTIVGLSKLNSGQILLNEEYSGNQKSNVSYMSDLNELFDISISDNIKFMTTIYGDYNMELLDKMMSNFEIDITKNISKISKGLMARLRLALCLARDVDVYILDEPFGGIDPKMRSMIIDDILEYVDIENKLLLISSHEIRDIENILDDVIVMSQSGVQYIENIDEFRQESKLSLQDWFKVNV